MAVIHIGNRPNRSGSATAKRNNLLFEVVGRRYKRQMIVYTSHAADGPATIMSDPMMVANASAIGSSYVLFNDSDTIATCVDLQITETDNPRIWDVEAIYDTDRLVAAVTDNPLNQPADIKSESRPVERPLERDLFGIPVVNSSNEKFDPPFTYVDEHTIYTITRNEASYDPNLINQFQNAVNSDTWQGNPPYTAKCNKIATAKQISNGITFVQHTYEIEIAPEGHWIWVLDQGFRDIEGNLFRDPRDFTPLSNPSLLNGRGRNITTAVAQVTGPIAVDATSINLVEASDALKFPPGPSPGTPHANFFIQLGSEVMLVTGGFGTGTFTVVRAQWGTTAAEYVNGGTIRLKPYYMRFFPSRVKAFADLNLPSLT